MGKPTYETLLATYRRTRAQYAADGLTDRVRVQDALIARLERLIEVRDA